MAGNVHEKTCSLSLLYAILQALNFRTYSLFFAMITGKKLKIQVTLS